MVTNPTLEKRLSEIEAEVRDLRRRLDSQAPPPNWLERVIGSFKDEPAFEEVLEYGRGHPSGRPPSRGRRVVKFLLDTDHISILQRQTGPEFAALVAMIGQHLPDDLAFSVVSF